MDLGDAPRCLSGQILSATFTLGLLLPLSHGCGQQRDLVFSEQHCQLRGLWRARGGNQDKLARGKG